MNHDGLIENFNAEFADNNEFSISFENNDNLDAGFTEQEEDFDITFHDDEDFEATLKDDDEVLFANFGDVQIIETGDYDKLFNKPIHQNITEFWDNQPQLIAKKDNLYFYTDYQVVGGQNIPGIKLGDGSSYLIDLPFLDAKFEAHANNNIIHITEDERDFWNKKNRALVKGEKLILTEL